MQKRKAQMSTAPFCGKKTLRFFAPLREPSSKKKAASKHETASFYKLKKETNSSFEEERCSGCEMNFGHRINFILKSRLCIELCFIPRLVQQVFRGERQLIRLAGVFDHRIHQE